MNLKRRGMVLDTRCVVCNRLDEDGAHLFLKCKVMVHVWELLALSHERQLLATKASAREVTETIMAMKEEKKSLCCIALWWCWSERNRIREGETRRDPVSLAHCIEATAIEWCRQTPHSSEGRTSRAPRWEKPSGDSVKVNCDAAYAQDSGNEGWGCVLRDSSGDVISVHRGRVQSLMNALQGELIAWIQGTQAAISVGVGHIIVETDALAVVQAVYSEEYMLSDVCNLVEEFRSLLTWNFISWQVQQRPRSCNRVAHELASLGSVCHPNEEPQLVSIPASIQSVIAEDSAFSE